MPRSISVYEDRSQKVNLAPSEVEDILALRGLWDNYSLTLQADNTLMARHYVGFASKGQTRLQVLPKILSKSDLSEEKQRCLALGVLNRMLAYTGYTAVKELPPQELERSKGDLFELFIGRFAKEFLKEFQKEVNREYVTVEETVQFVRGKILFPQTLRMQRGLSHLHFVSNEEFTINNLLNRIFKTIFWNLKRIAIDPNNQLNIRKALFLLEDVETINLSNTVFDRVRFHRQNDSYKPIFNLAKLLCANLSPGVVQGDVFTFGFLVPLNKLFENFVFHLLKGGLEEFKLRVRHEQPIRNLLVDEDGRETYPIKPDVVVSRGDDTVLILDAKYKDPIEDGEIHPAESDVYQVLTYALRYNCRRVALVYPAFYGADSTLALLRKFRVPAATGDVEIYILSVDILSDNVDMTRIRLCNAVLKILSIDDDIKQVA